MWWKTSILKMFNRTDKVKVLNFYFWFRDRDNVWSKKIPVDPSLLQGRTYSRLNAVALLTVGKSILVLAAHQLAALWGAAWWVKPDVGALKPGSALNQPLCDPEQSVPSHFLLENGNAAFTWLELWSTRVVCCERSWNLLSYPWHEVVQCKLHFPLFGL